MPFKRDLRALGAVLLAVCTVALYRHLYVEPREWGAACLDLSRAPAACLPRAALLWLQHWQLWGAGALVLGTWSLAGAPRAVQATAVAAGVIAVLNFNATWGMLGAALGGWSWIGTAACEQRSGARPSNETRDHREEAPPRGGGAAISG